jgi:hypothetical protein
VLSNINFKDQEACPDLQTLFADMQQLLKYDPGYFRRGGEIWLSLLIMSSNMYRLLNDTQNIKLLPNTKIEMSKAKFKEKIPYNSFTCLYGVFSVKTSDSSGSF